MRWQKRHRWLVIGAALGGVALLISSMRDDSGGAPEEAEGTPAGLVAASKRAPDVVTLRVRERERRPISKPESNGFSRFVKKLDDGKLPRLSREEVEVFLSDRNRDAESLLFAFRETKDESYLREALERFPDDPATVSTALMRLDLQSGERQALVAALKESAPENSLTNCLAALEEIEAGRQQEALAELSAAVDKSFQDFTVAGWQTGEEALTGAGYSAAEAKFVAGYSLAKPALGAFSKIQSALERMAVEASGAGDQAAVDSINEIRRSLGRQLQADPALVGYLTGNSLERAALEGEGGEEARQRIEYLEGEKERLMGQQSQIIKLLNEGSLPDRDWIFYFDRVKQFGEAAANEWLLERYE